MQDLKDVSAMVSGAASKLGSEVVGELVRRGAKVLAADSSEEAVEEAIAKLGLENSDEIFAHALEGADFVSWWDLANLIAAYLPTLNLFVHVGEEKSPVPVRDLKAAALSEAQALSTDSFMTAIGRFEKIFVTAQEEDAMGACAVAVLPAADVTDVPGALCHASTKHLASSLSAAYEAAGLNIRVHAVRPTAGDPKEAAAEVLGLFGR